MKMVRAALGLTIRECAELTGVSHDTITRLEAGETLKESTVARVRAALESAGVIFIDQNGNGPGVRLARR